MTAPTLLTPPVTIKHAAAAKLLTNSAPGPDSEATLTIINLGTELVWLSNDSNMGSGQGVPLEGGTSTPWGAGGTIYAIADDANDSDQKLILTTAGIDYKPSPYALAAYSADQVADRRLLSQDYAGVAMIASNTINHNLASTFDVSGFAAVVVITSSQQWKYRFTDLGGDSISSNFFQYGPSESGNAFRLRCDGPLLTITQLAAGSGGFTIVGLSVATPRVDARGQDGLGESGLIQPGAGGWTAGTPQSYALANNARLQGAQTLYWWINGTTLDGTLLMVLGDGTTIPVADSAQLTTRDSGSQRILSRTIAVPPSAVTWQFMPANSVATGVQTGFTLIPLAYND